MKTLVISLFFCSFIHATLTQYETNHFCFTPKGQSETAVIRTFTQNGTRQQLVVDTQTLQTRFQPMVKTLGHPCGDSRYTRLLRQSIAAPSPLQNDGITQGEKGITITTDLCPSSKEGFEHRLYKAMIEKFPHPVPVTLFITGRWIEKHTEAFAQFLVWEKEQNLSITWGNHTYTHPYHPKAPLEKNFALSPDYNLTEDTLKLEKMLIEKGVTPSVFFRFPGLVSDAKTVQAIHDLGLITIGSDTWIAKGEKVKEGSIILLHGNKNEPKGVEIFLEILHKEKIEKLEPLGKVFP
jgi:peptidoglycan/xylan/chitin deacetylase (PgdA/CDA1 family)